MTLKTEYLTIASPASISHVEKKSVFLTHSYYVKSENEAHSLVLEARKKHHDATHTVYAYYIYGENDQAAQKFFDDGEPSGTAGRPVLDAILRLNLENVLVIVTRFFGGTKLGAPGLMRAYGKAASLCLAASGTKHFTFCKKYSFTIDYSQLVKVELLIENSSSTLISKEFSENVRITLDVPIAEYERFVEELQQAGHK